MKKTNCAILNLIVSILSLVAIVGYFMFPFWKIKATITFNEDLAKLIFEDEEEEEETSDDALENADEDILDLLVEELVEEDISLEFTISIDTTFLAKTALASSKKQTERFIHSLIDDFVDSIDEDTLEDLEDSIARASVSAAIKVELKELSKNNDMSVEDVMDEIGISDSYLDSSTDRILRAIEDENATVDSVTNVVIDIVKDVYSRYGDSSLADESFEHLTTEGEAELRVEISDIISSFANEDGSFNSDGLISTLIDQLLSSEDEEDYEEEASLTPAQNIAFAVEKYLAPVEYATKDASNKSINEKVADAIKDLVDDDVIDAVNLVSIVLFAFISFCTIWWVILLLKILIRLGMKNPLVRLATPIIFGGLPFIIFFIIPTIAVKLLSSPPSFMVDLLGRETAKTVKTLFKGAIDISFSSSAIFAFVCGFILFVFGFYYARQRRAIKRKIKEEKRENQMSGGLY